MQRLFCNLVICVTLFCGLGSFANAQDREVPYWASLDAEEVYMRVGPSDRYRIDWVYKRKGLPVKVIRLQQGWRLVEEMDGTQGWIWNSLISLNRHAIVVGDGVAEIREFPKQDSALLWNVEPSVSGQLGECDQGWCQIDFGGRQGWILRDRLWGAGSP